MKIGVITDCFKTDVETAIKRTHEMGISGVQIYATSGEFSPEAMTAEKTGYFKGLLKKYNLTLSALCGDLGGHGFEIAADNAVKIEKTKRIIDLAEKFDCHVVTTHIGVIPVDSQAEKYTAMQTAMRELGIYAREHDITLAIETGPETAAILRKFLDSLDGGVGVNLDPANFVMVTGQDPVEAVEILADYIVHTHAKDGVMLNRADPAVIYNHFAEGGIDDLNLAEYFRETVLGEGDVDFTGYLRALKGIGYDGFLTIEREVGADPAADIKKAAGFLQKNLI